MRVPLAWLSEWIAWTVPLEELIERLTLGGLEVEEVLRTGPDLSAFRVGRVVSCDPHPDAQRLSVCRVDLGASEVEVVCGAPNVAAGQRVAVALPGTRMPDGTKLKRTKIRGVVSSGMICSEAELGLGEDAAGILVLDPQAPVGATLDTVLQAGGVALELAVTPNRGDVASLLGVAREVRAHFGGEIRIPPCDPPEADRLTGADLRVEIEDPEACHRYVARVVRGLRPGPAPDAVRRKLEGAGLRAIGLAVDVTNLVLLELGQPIHAFDLATLRGGVIRVRRAHPGEKLRTIDGQLLALGPEDLVIADAERAIALAGIMGGAETAVRDDTRDVAIESAHFLPSVVRRTARRFGLQTEASYRFERGVDRRGIARAADRAARLLAELGGGAVSRERIELRGAEPSSPSVIRLVPDRVNRLLGTALGRAEIAALLGRVDVSCEPDVDDALRCRIPSHRNDLEGPHDLIEEVVRIHGCDRVAATLPVAELRAVEVPEAHRLAEGVRDSLRSAGMVEGMSLPFVAATDLDRIRLSLDDPRRSMIRLENPIVEERRWLRPLLVPTLLELAQRNRSRQIEHVRVFEIARVFRRGEPGALPDERLHVGGVVLRGESRRLWESAQPPPLFFEAKGIVERLLEDAGRKPSFHTQAAEPFLHPGAACAVGAGDRTVGFLGEVHPEVAERFELGAPCAVFEIDLGALLGVEASRPTLREVSRHPAVRRDLAVVLAEEIPAGELLEAIRKAGGTCLAEADIFDRYRGPGLPEGKTSLGFRLVFQRADRTLTDGEVAGQMERIVQALARGFGATVR